MDQATLDVAVKLSGLWDMLYHLWAMSLHHCF
jgi:hypothetical protein